MVLIRRCVYCKEVIDSDRTFYEDKRVETSAVCGRFECQKKLEWDRRRYSRKITKEGKVNG